MNNKIPKIHDIGGIKTRWGTVDEASYSFSYPGDFVWCGGNEVDLGDMLTEVECSLKFIKDSTPKIVNYTCKRFNSNIFSLKAFLKQMRKPTSDTFEGFPKNVIINDDKFRICSINYG